MKALFLGLGLIAASCGAVCAQSCDQRLGPGLDDLKRISAVLNAQQVIFQKYAGEFDAAYKAKTATFEQAVMMRMLGVGHCERAAEAYRAFQSLEKTLSSSSCSSFPKAQKDAFLKSGVTMKAGLDGCNAGLKQIDAGLEEMRPK